MAACRYCGVLVLMPESPSPPDALEVCTPLLCRHETNPWRALSSRVAVARCDAVLAKVLGLLDTLGLGVGASACLAFVCGLAVTGAFAVEVVGADGAAVRA
jgi:hypothetical protein